MSGIDPLADSTDLIARVGRENIQTKGRRYLIEGRLSVRLVSHSQVVASCRGTGEVWTVGYQRGGWYCTCPAKGRCSHLEALQLVVVRPAEDVAP